MKETRVRSRMMSEIEEQPAVLSEFIERMRGSERFPSFLKEGNKVIGVGMGSSLYALNATLPVLRERFAVFQVVRAFEFIYYPFRVKGFDAAVAVSQSGESADTVRVAEVLKANGLPVLAVTNDENSTLARLADDVLVIGAGEEVSSATKTYTATLCALYMLASGGRVAEEMKRVADWVRSMLADDVKERVKEWASSLELEAFYILGTGPNWATAEVAALIIEEKACIPVKGMSAGDFLHGPIETVESGSPVFIILPPDGSSCESLRRLADRLRDLEARLYVVGAGEILNGIPKRNSICIPRGVPEIYSPIPAIIPFQLLAHELALKAGNDPDCFRNMGKVQMTV